MLIGKPARDNDPVFFPEPYWDIFLICHIVSVLPRHADRSAYCVLRSFSYSHACGFLQRVHHVKPAGLKLVPIETKSVSKDVSHDCNFLLCSVIIHGTEHQLVIGGDSPCRYS